jgi:hypothetical protein
VAKNTVGNMANSCKDAKLKLMQCMIGTKCMQERERRSGGHITAKDMTDCLATSETDVTQCQPLRDVLYRCNRGQFDNRTRFRGNNYSKGDAQEPGSADASS